MSRHRRQRYKVEGDGISKLPNISSLLKERPEPKKDYVKVVPLALLGRAPRDRKLSASWRISLAAVKARRLTDSDKTEQPKREKTLSGSERVLMLAAVVGARRRSTDSGKRPPTVKKTTPSAPVHGVNLSDIGLFGDSSDGSFLNATQRRRKKKVSAAVRRLAKMTTSTEAESDGFSLAASGGWANAKKAEAKAGGVDWEGVTRFVIR